LIEADYAERAIRGFRGFRGFSVWIVWNVLAPCGRFGVHVRLPYERISYVLSCIDRSFFNAETGWAEKLARFRRITVCTYSAHANHPHSARVRRHPNVRNHRRGDGGSPRTWLRISRTVYREAFPIELRAREVPFDREVRLPIRYRDHLLPVFYKADFVCFGEIIVELKALHAIGPNEQAQAMNYLKAANFQRALLLNFGAPSLQHRRIVNNLQLDPVKRS
jgi:GxxExxY protein